MHKHKLRGLILLGSVTDTEGAAQVKCNNMCTISDIINLNAYLMAVHT